LPISEAYLGSWLFPLDSQLFSHSSTFKIKEAPRLFFWFMELFSADKRMMELNL